MKYFPSVSSIINIIQVTNNQGVSFNVRVLNKGDKYGLEFKLTHNDTEPVIEFYDTEYAHTEFGQFASSYYAETLAESKNDGLMLYGGSSKWVIDGNAWQQVLGIARLITTQKKGKF